MKTFIRHIGRKDTKIAPSGPHHFFNHHQTHEGRDIAPFTSAVIYQYLVIQPTLEKCRKGHLNLVIVAVAAVLGLKLYL